ncbi:hypothetical protein SMGD1_0315 [Sulfurimonas gotlandica GD1]|uniref:Uncharacterized protein n=1 Tax=Sulfurimonas gotlandica (strain DSM 19862 / JCM 16533 / GD1) TaxID=929558 RepID=B6BNN9_SULGG|nr:hypothetical protein [Sulfurimonas gotlandica]EDZ61241.1 hypothetical protein CBGD1_66 [Sulfurimonas gotlandica GD1]EHP28842.1 hypothetical protein SMGD1_0315 [Sulfurimonas gotlandica GD1]
MSEIKCIEFESVQSDVIADLLTIKHNEILSKWKEQKRVQEVLNHNNVNTDFFIKHFGSRVLDYFIGVLRKEQEAGHCPVIIVMLKFFSKHGFMLDEIYRICSGMRNTVVDVLIENDIHHSETLFKETIDLFDMNFSGVIKEYIEISNNISEKCSSKELLKSTISEVNLEEYFALENDDGKDSITFRTDDADDMIEYLNEILEYMSLAMINSNQNDINSVAKILHKTSNVLLHYSPYLDELAFSMKELSESMIVNTKLFMEVLTHSGDDMLKLFDAVVRDMDSYIQRFSVENIAMNNVHQIHAPTTLSIKQIITMFAPHEVQEGEMEFF